MDSRGVFVVQRTFATVRRGYDPDEVDRHLELVSEWFNRGLAAPSWRPRRRSRARG
jgi:DivIVA domain-containing protein